MIPFNALNSGLIITRALNGMWDLVRIYPKARVIVLMNMRQVVL